MRRVSRRAFLGAAVLGVGALVVGLRRKIRIRLDRWTELADFTATPPLVPHDPVTERRTVAMAQGSGPAGNVDAVLAKLGGIERIVGKNDVVIVKVSAQWWNQGMTNVAAVKRLLEVVLAREGFTGEVIVFENVHFRDAQGGGLARAWTRPSERNVDVPGWNKMGDLVAHFPNVGFVGLIDAAKSTLADDDWHDASHEHGVYGGDGRGPIPPGELRDGYRWDFEKAFRRKRSRVDYAQTPLTWPVFTSPKSGLRIDLRDGVFDGAKKLDRKLTWISMTTVNEHTATGMTGACKSAMGIVDMSAGRMGTHPLAADYQSVHYFGSPNASWRMAGPLAHFAKEVRAPDLYLAVAEWVAARPRQGWDDSLDARLEASSAHHVGAIVAGQDPVAVDTVCARRILMPLEGGLHAAHDLDQPDSMLSRFLRYWRETARHGTLDPALVDVV